MIDLKIPFVNDKAKRFLMIMLISAFMILAFVKYVFMIPFSKTILLCLYVMIMLCCDKDELVAAGLCTIPLLNVFNHNYGLLICIGIYVIRYYKEIKLNKAMLVVLAIFIWEALHFFCVGFTVKGLITFILPYVFSLLLIYGNAKEIDYKKVIRIFAKCTLFVCFILFFKLLMDYNFDLGEAFYQRHRLGMNLDKGYHALEYNANALGVVCVIAITGLVQLWISKKGKIVDIILCIGLLICGLLTMSKTFLLCLAVLVFLVWLIQKGNVKEKIKFGMLALLTIVLFIVVIAFVMPEFFSSFVGRFTVGDLTSGRVGLFIQYTQFMFASLWNLLFGVGVNGHDEALQYYYGRSFVNVPHNGIQEIIVVWGIVGLALFGLFMYYFFKEAKNTHKQKLINYFPFILIFIKIQLGQLVTTNYTILMLGLIYLSLCYEFDEPMTEVIENKVVVIKDRSKLRLKKRWRKK